MTDIRIPVVHEHADDQGDVHTHISGSITITTAIQAQILAPLMARVEAVEKALRPTTNGAGQEPAAPVDAGPAPCGGNRCYKTEHGWMHSSKSYGSCCVNRGEPDPVTTHADAAPDKPQGDEAPSFMSQAEAHRLRAEIERWNRADKKLRSLGIEVYHDHKRAAGDGDVVIVCESVRIATERDQLKTRVAELELRDGKASLQISDQMRDIDRLAAQVKELEETERAQNRLTEAQQAELANRGASINELRAEVKELEGKLAEARLYIAQHTSPTRVETMHGSIVDRIDAALAKVGV